MVRTPQLARRALQRSNRSMGRPACSLTTNRARNRRSDRPACRSRTNAAGVRAQRPGPRGAAPHAEPKAPGRRGWSGRRGSNPRHAAWKAAALPAELLPPEATAKVPRGGPSIDGMETLPRFPQPTANEDLDQVSRGAPGASDGQARRSRHAVLRSVPSVPRRPRPRGHQAHDDRTLPLQHRRLRAMAGVFTAVEAIAADDPCFADHAHMVELRQVATEAAWSHAQQA